MTSKPYKTQSADAEWPLVENMTEPQLRALLAEMLALAEVLPAAGSEAAPVPASETPEAIEAAEAMFDNMPV